MPVTIQIHHAAADGYHCSLFFSDVKEMCSNPGKYLKQNKSSRLGRKYVKNKFYNTYCD